jgi:hypothetical protein
MESILVNLANAQQQLVNLVATSEARFREPAASDRDAVNQQILSQLANAQVQLVSVTASLVNGGTVLPAVQEIQSQVAVAPAPAPVPVEKPKLKRATRRTITPKSSSESESETEAEPHIEDFVLSVVDVPLHQKELIKNVENETFDPVQLTLLLHGNNEHPEQQNIYFNKKQVHTRRAGMWISQDYDDAFVTSYLRKLIALYYSGERQTRMLRITDEIEYPEPGYMMTELKNDEDCALRDKFKEFKSQLKSVLQSLYKGKPK